MDTETFKAYAAIIVKSIAGVDAEVGKTAQEYVDTAILEKEGKAGEITSNVVADKFPHTTELPEVLVHLIANLFKLSMGFMVSTQ